MATSHEQFDQGLATIKAELKRALARKGLQEWNSHSSPTATTFSVRCGFRIFNLVLTRQEIDDSQAHGTYFWLVKVRRFVAALPTSER